MIHLTRAYLCADCSTISASSSHCPACGNRCGLLNLSSVLDRDPAREEIRAVMGIFNAVINEQFYKQQGRV